METLESPSTNGRTSHVETFVLPRAKRKRPPLLVIVALLVALALVAATVAIYRVRASATVTYDTAPVVRQDLVQSVTATGTVNPQNTIAVGTQESGTISEIDVDYNSHVKQGQILAKIDPTALQASLDQAEASLAQAEAQAQAAQATAGGAQASIGNAAATARAAQATALAALATARSNAAGVAAAMSNVTKAQSALTLAQQTVNRDQSLLGQGYIAQSQVDSDRSNLVAAQTALEAAQSAVQQAQLSAQAGVSQAQASSSQSVAQAYSTQTAQAQAQTQAADASASEAAVAAAQANVRTAQNDLAKTVITSPVDGTVIARDVSIGQTVAASLQTPTLFSIAQNLDKMEVDLAVGEPDIGNVKAGDGVQFSVLAYPNRTFNGVVSQVRINPTTTNNVVTYTTVVLVSNVAGQLLPGMTANAQIHVAKSTNALIVPLAALSYQPTFSGHGSARRPHGAAANGASASGAGTNATAASPWGATTAAAAPLASAGSQSRIYVLRDGKLQRINVRVALVSGTQAAVTPLQGTLGANDAVVTGDSGGASGTPHAGRTTGAAANPLTGGAGSSMRGIH